MARARRLTLRIGRDGPVLTVPKRLPDAAARSFLADQEAWLRERLAASPQQIRVAPGAEILAEGKPHTIAIAAVRTPRIEGKALLVPGPEAKVGPQLQAFLKTLARHRLVAASDHYAHALGVRFSGITLRDPEKPVGFLLGQGKPHVFVAARHGAAGDP